MRLFLQLLACGLAAGFLAGCDAESVAPELSREGHGQLQAMLRGEVERGYVGSAVGLVALHGEIAFLEAVGEAGPRAPMTDDAIVRLASMSKPITAAAVMILREEGKLDLDDPVARFIPAFHELRIASEGGSMVPPDRPVTVRDLLTHTGGLAVRGAEFEVAWDEAMALDGAITTRELSERIARIPMASQPGTAYDYGLYGSSYEILAAVIEAASGLRLDRFLAQRIFEPLGMVDTYFHVPEAKRDRLAARYRRRDGVLEVDAARGAESPPSAFFSGGGGLRTTIRDYFRFAQCLLDEGALDGVRILDEDSVRQMMTDHVGEMYPSPNDAHGWGFGGRVRRRFTEDSSESLGSYGWNGGTGTFFWIDPQADLVAIVFAPFRPPPPHEIYTGFQRAVYRALDN